MISTASCGMKTSGGIGGTSGTGGIGGIGGIGGTGGTGGIGGTGGTCASVLSMASTLSITTSVHGQNEFDRRSFSHRALRLNRAMVREYRLTRDRETQPGSTGLRRDVRLPDAPELLRRDSAARVRYGDLHRASAVILALRVLRSHAHRYAAGLSIGGSAARVHGVQDHVRERTRQRVVMPVNHRDAV